jgi:hypothetical protein
MQQRTALQSVSQQRLVCANLSAASAAAMLPPPHTHTTTTVTRPEHLTSTTVDAYSMRIMCASITCTTPHSLPTQSVPDCVAFTRNRCVGRPTTSQHHIMLATQHHKVDADSAALTKRMAVPHMVCSQATTPPPDCMPCCRNSSLLASTSPHTTKVGQGDPPWGHVAPCACWRPCNSLRECRGHIKGAMSDTNTSGGGTPLHIMHAPLFHGKTGVASHTGHMHTLSTTPHAHGLLATARLTIPSAPALLAGHGVVDREHVLAL